jgi:hypothetical protein
MDELISDLNPSSQCGKSVTAMDNQMPTSIPDFQKPQNANLER